MSLINEALKKVQSQAPGAPLSGPASGAPTSPPAEQAKYRGWLTLVLSLMVLVLMAALIMVLLSAAWKGDEPEVIAASPTPTLPHSAPIPYDDTTADLAPLVYRSVEEDPAIENPSLLTSSAPTSITPVTTDPEPEIHPAPPVVSTPKVKEAPPKEVTVIVQQSRTAQADVPAAPAKSAAVQEFIDALDIRGVMSSGQRILIHNRSSGRTQAYQAGSILDESLNLSILKVEDRLITFTTDDGQIYTKRF